MSIDESYLNVLRELYEDTALRDGRNGNKTYSKFGGVITHDLSEGFPLLNCKKVHVRSVLYELLWFISGSTNVKDLQKNGVTIWDEWADPVTGELNEVYGKQWSRYEDIRVLTRDEYRVMKHGPNPKEDFVFVGHFTTNSVQQIVVKREIDQVSNLVKGIHENPYGRRHILDSWNVGVVDEAALPPCHVLYQFYVTTDGRLSANMYQRSADWFLGVPFNIASLSFLTHMIAQQTGYEPGVITVYYGDNHLYANHVEQAKELLDRTGYKDKPIPKLTLRPKPSIKDYVFEDFTIEDYDPLPVIKAPVAV